jgi:hypothetical protein
MLKYLAGQEWKQRLSSVQQMDNKWRLRASADSWTKFATWWEGLENLRILHFPVSQELLFYLLLDVRDKALAIT